MIFAAASRAAGQVTRPKFRSALFNSIGLTIVLFFALWYGLEGALGWASGFLPSSLLWLEGAFSWFLGFGILIAGGFVLAPATALFAGFFLDDLVDDIEANTSPGSPVGKALPFLQSLWSSVRFLGLVLAVNLLCLILLILPGINVMIFFLANGYLLGREYFEFVARRHGSVKDVKALRQRHGGQVFAAGLLMAFLLTIPLLNLLTPFFGAAMMVHLHRTIQGDKGRC